MSHPTRALDPTGTIALVTGATAGIGRAVASQLAARGATVWAVGRDAARTRATARELSAATGGRAIAAVADLARLADVRRLAAEILAQTVRLNVLVLNAGVVSRERRQSPDGFELQFAVNHLAPFLLTHLLCDRLVASAPARVVTSTTLHPGIVRTRLSHDYMGNPVFRLLESLISISPERAAAHVVRLAADPDVADETGTYYRGKRRAAPALHAQDEALQERLWLVSAQLTGVAT